MVTLFCAIVGVEGSAFAVEVDENGSVYALKEAICARKMYEFSADKLLLFPAKTKSPKGFAWLLSSSEDVKKLKKGEKPPLIESLTKKDQRLMPNLPVSGMLKEIDPPSLGQIHVLVVLPDLKKRKRGETTSLSDLLETCSQEGSLPMEGDFLQMFEWDDQDCGKVKDIKAIGDIVGFTGSKFFVRKEILCVLENLKRFKANFDEGDVNPQFIFLGSPGTGKSCVLALLCFYVAATSDHPVLWYRSVRGGRENSFTLLFYQKKYYQWIDDEINKYDRLYDELRKLYPDLSFWPCLDGVSQKKVYSNDSRHFRHFTLLATSGQFDPKGDGLRFFTLCLMPYWKREDLERLARAFKDPKEEDIADRYFASGGSLCEFLNATVSNDMNFVLARIQTPKHARSLLTPLCCAADTQIDRIRMRGVKDVTAPLDYVKASRWTAAVTSSFVLQHLTTLMKPTFFGELAGIARGMKDDRLEGVALENYFHAQVRNKQTIVMNYRAYDNVDRSNMKKEAWEARMLADTGSITCAPTSKVKWSGDNIKQCVQEMENWANDLSSTDYWIPMNSLCETIDAVAKCQFKNEEESQICFLQLTKAKKHKCDAAILWMLAQPFVAKAKVCYIALHSSQNEDISFMDAFRLSPDVISNSHEQQRIPLYVATYRLEPSSS